MMSSLLEVLGNIIVAAALMIFKFGWLAAAVVMASGLVNNHAVHVIIWDGFWTLALIYVAATLIAGAGVVTAVAGKALDT